ncbi:MAG: helix-turn-helix domain-containing GNAT family N-acetyltransferase [Terriglobales bacterium]|jgi:DNA-binding MarR family transcriptional regulator/GNAT superfamily N-acetyltransferase
MARPPLASPVPHHVQSVRRFNRFYTRQIGLLEEGLLDSPFSLTEARTLYELARGEHSTAVALCQELGLDAGYLSRILRRFEKQRWIEKKISAEDARQSLLHLTPEGKKIFQPLDARSSAQVRAILGRLSPAAQDDLVCAMQTIQSILAPEAKNNEGRSYRLRPHKPGDMGWVVYRHAVLYSQEYGYDESFEALVAEIVAAFLENFNPPRERCWMAESDGRILGSVFVVEKSKAVAKLRLLLVEPAARGLGIGKHLVAECVRFARQAGYKTMVLWTQSELTAARQIYQGAGFQRASQQPHQSWGRKDLVSETWKLKL